MEKKLIYLLMDSPQMNTIPFILVWFFMHTDCEESYTSVNNMNAVGGSELIGAYNVDACMRACTAMASCVGFDYSNNRCWSHTSSSFANKGNSIGAVQYTRGSTCASPTPSGMFDFEPTCRITHSFSHLPTFSGIEK